MKIDKYEIEMLGVNDAEALIIHFHESEPNPGKEHIVLIDAGNKSDGKKIIDFINEHYHTNVIDLAICTHSDSDHFGGFITFLEEMKKADQTKEKLKIKKFLLNAPYNWDSKIGKQLYSTEDGRTNLVDLLMELKIEVQNGFADDSNWENPFPGVLTIISPSEKYYRSLQDSICRQKGIKPLVTERRKLFTQNNIDDYSNDASAANKSSLAVLFTPIPHKNYVFAAEMEEDAFENMSYELKTKCKNVSFLKIPHHGSNHNINSKILNHYNPKTVFISATDKTLNKNNGLKNYFKNKNSIEVYTTHGTNNVCLRQGYEKKKNYSKASPIWQ
ncbi:MAG: hypothetical protein J1F67_11095 [Muribaculaceae bacterium]|nr:hypothetical protein [Muribaculaceae bacterium]